MKKHIKKQKQASQLLQKLYSEACQEIIDRGNTISNLSEELDYYYGFIEYHHLESIFEYFRTNAHKEDYPDLPFDHYTL